MTKYIIQTYKVIKNNFIINSDSNLSTDNLELNIAGTTALPKNITDLKNENVIIQLKLKLGNENSKIYFYIETTTEISVKLDDEMLDNIKDEIENSCSIIALEKLVNTANKIIDDYNVTNIIIPPINELLSDNKENRD